MEMLQGRCLPRPQYHPPGVPRSWDTKLSGLHLCPSGPDAKCFPSPAVPGPLTWPASATCHGVHPSHDDWLHGAFRTTHRTTSTAPARTLGSLPMMDTLAAKEPSMLKTTNSVPLGSTVM